MRFKFFLFILLVPFFFSAGNALAGSLGKACVDEGIVYDSDTSDSKTVVLIVGEDFEAAYQRESGKSANFQTLYHDYSSDIEKVRGSLLVKGTCSFVGEDAAYKFDLVDLQQQCACNASLTECVDTYMYGGHSFNVPSGMTIPTPGKTCDVAVAKEYCCCKKVSAGSLTTSRSCVRVPTKACSESIFSGTFDADSATVASDPNYPSFPIDDMGGCSKWESESKDVKAEDKTNADVQLRAEAANTLNPMKFKLGTAGVNDFIGRAINALTFFMGSLLLVFYVYAGILWMTAAGNSERAGKAKQIVVWSTLGVVVILASYMIVSFVFKTVG